ncbi:type II secretion system F family protein [Ferrimonas marina]|uniref:MSHA biogenesis protein MshG n=1 Tax=Ferrimonas marina TaxID=299255 RepID=A0A1M5Y0G5_9GAMM|nr:type II secretion system F family protein [Ferrimonas marina]SHI05547.1 MSHA biogenesis protein MshG [Ferrimonas marina]
MIQYQYRGRDSRGQLVTGELEANNATSAADQLMRRAIVVLELTPRKAGQQHSWLNQLKRRVPLPVLMLFTRQMQSLTRSGVPLLQALNGLAESQHHPMMRDTLVELKEQLVAGRTLSAAMNDHPRVFSDMYVAMIHVGENTGKLDESFERLYRHLEREQDTRRQIASATRYPILVVAVITLALLVLNLLVIPKFADMFSKFNADLPWPTQVLISTSNFFVNYWYLMLLALLAAVLGWVWYTHTEAGGIRWDRWKLKLPLVGTLLQRASLSRFGRSLGMMLRGGVPVNQALQLVAAAVDNRFMHGRIVAMRRAIEGGDNLHRSARQSELFTPLVLQMLAVGEETGRTDELLDDLAEFYDREVEFELKSLTAKIEPILLVVVAGMVLVLALGIYLPMWDMFSAIQGGR